MQRNKDCRLCALNTKDLNNPCVMGRYLFGHDPTKHTVMIVGDNANPIEDMFGQAGRGDLVRVFERFKESVNIYYTNLTRCNARKVKITISHLRACNPYFTAEYHEVAPHIILALGDTVKSYLLAGHRKARITRGAGYKSQHYGFVIPTWSSLDVYKQPWKANDVVTDLFIAVQYCKFRKSKAKGLSFVRNGLGACKAAIEVADTIAFDIETDTDEAIVKEGGALDPLTGRPWILTLSCKHLIDDGEGGMSGDIVVDHYLFDRSAFEDGMWDQVGDALSKCDATILAQNGKFDLKWLRYHCIGWDNVQLTYDTQLTHHLINENTDHSLNHLEWRYNPSVAGHKEDVDLENVPASKHDQESFEQYAVGDTASTLEIDDLLECDARPLANMLARASSILATTEAFGVKIDEPELIHQLQYYGSIAFTYEEQLRQFAEEELGYVDFNCNSSTQIQSLVYDRLKLPKFKDEDGKLSTDDYALSILQEDAECSEEQHTVLQLIRDHRTYEKLRQTLQGIREKHVKIGDDIVIRTEYQMSFVVTGRLSSRNPNLQNIPKNGALKKVFIPREGKVFVEADYSQAEYRIAAQMAQDQEMIALLKDGADFHEAMQQKLASMGVILDRTKTKNFNFAILYGAGKRKLAKMTGLRVDEVVDIQGTMERAFPTLFGYIKGIPDTARKNGNTIRGLFGRVRRVPYASSNVSWWRSRADRQLINSPMQGGASDLTMNAIVEVHDRYRETPMNSPVVLTVHDSIVWEVSELSAEEFIPGIRHVMEHPNTEPYGFKFDVPLKVDVNILRKSWGDKGKLDDTTSEINRSDNG